MKVTALLDLKWLTIIVENVEQEKKITGGITLTKKRNYNRRQGIKLSCPECGEGLDGKLSKNGPTNIAGPDAYRCGKCKNEWFPDELKQEEYKTAVFKGADGEYHFVAMTDKLKADYRERGVWDPEKHPNRYRRKSKKGKYAGGMNKNDVNMLKRLRKK